MPTMAPGAETALVVLIVTQIAAVVLRFSRRKRYAAWAIVAGTLPIFALIAAEISGYGLTPGNLKSVGFECAVLALALLSFWRYTWFCFWLAWIANAALIGLAIYLMFFWHVFS